MKKLSRPPKLGRRTSQSAADVGRSRAFRRPRLVAEASSPSSASFSVLRPPGAGEEQQRTQGTRRRPVLLHIPGADGTGLSLGRQAGLLSDAGFDVWSSSFDVGEGERRRGEDPWSPLVDAADAAIRAAFSPGTDEDEGLGSAAAVSVVLAESFGACLALRVAARDPGLFSSLVLVNPATALGKSDEAIGGTRGRPSPSALPAALVRVAAATGVARFLPVPVYRAAASVLTPLLLLDDGGGATETAASDAASRMMSLGRGPATRDTMRGVAARLELLSTADPGSVALLRASRTERGTLLLASARDALLPSVAECGRLCRLMSRPRSGGFGGTEAPAAARVILPDSGHAALLERGVDVAAELERAGLGAASFAAAAGRAASAPSTSTAPPLPPPWALADEEFDAALESLRPLREVVRPLVAGSELLPSHAPFAPRPPPARSTPAAAAAAASASSGGSVDASRPVLFVGNHSRFGIYDLVFLLAELYARGIRARGLAHRAHFTTGSPLGPVFERYGAVAATPRSAFKLLSRGEAVLLFPGGAAEVNKGKGEDYRLLWKESPDFVRLAARFGASIVPFAAVGAEEAYDVLADQRDILGNPLLAPLTRAAFASLDLEAEEALLPVAAAPLSLGLLPSLPIPLPSRLERLYFEFSEPIDARSLVEEVGADAAYARVRSEVEGAIERRRAARASDPMRPARARVAEAARRFAPRRLGL